MFLPERLFAERENCFLVELHLLFDICLRSQNPVDLEFGLQGDQILGWFEKNQLFCISLDLELVDDAEDLENMVLEGWRQHEYKLIHSDEQMKL